MFAKIWKGWQIQKQKSRACSLQCMHFTEEDPQPFKQQEKHQFVCKNI